MLFRAVAKLKRAVKRRSGDPGSDAPDLAVAAHVQEVVNRLTAPAIEAREIDRALALAQTFAVSGNQVHAEEIFRAIVQHAPARAEAHAGLALALLAQERDGDALVTVQEGLALHPRTVDLHLVAAAAHERLGALGKAAEHLSQVLTFEADHLEVNRRLARVQDRLGDVQGSIRCWRTVVALTGGEDLEALTALGIALSDDGQRAEAIQILSDLTSRRKDGAAAYADLGMAFLAAGRLEEALTTLSRALEIDPRSAQAHCGLGLTFQKLERWQQAADAFKATERLAPESVVGPFNLGLALEALGDRKAARHALLRAAAIAPDDGEIREALERSFVRPSAGGEANGVVPLTQFDASINGDLKSFQLFDVLEFLRLQHKTGALVVSSRQGAGQVRLVHGAITTASAPGVKRLGEILIERKLVAPATLEAVLSRKRGVGDENLEFLGSILLRDGLIDRRQIHQIVFEQVMMALEEMLRWKEGAFSFHPGEEGAPPVISFDPQRIMLDLARRKDERERGPIPSAR